MNVKKEKKIFNVDSKVLNDALFLFLIRKDHEEEDHSEEIEKIVKKMETKI